MAEQAKATETSATEPVAAARPPARPGMRNLPRLFALATLFMLGVWGSWQVHQHLHPHTDDDTPAPLAVPKDLRAERDTPAEIIARGDNALRQHRHAEALAHYNDLRDAGILDTPMLSYRLALCQEALGLVEKATASYRRAIGKSAAGPLTFACHLGLSRCMLRQNDAAEARALLYPFLFDETRQHGAPERFVTEAWYVVALALARANAAPTVRLAQDAVVSSSAAPLDTILYLQEIAGNEPSRVEPALAAQPVMEVQKESDTEPAWVLRVHQPAQPAAALLERLAAEADLKAVWTAAAGKALADRTLDLHLRNWTLIDVFEHVADRFDLDCQWDEATVRLATRQEADPKALSESRRALTQRVLQGAVRVDKAHPHAPPALLELGNLEAAESRWNEAAFWYNRVIRETRISPHVTAAYYNLARARRQNHEPDQARRAFFRVIDYAPGHELAHRALVQIGQLYLIEDDTRNAIAHLKRAEALAVRAQHQPVATLALAAAHLHAGDPLAARKAIGQARSILELEPYRPTAAFLDCYAHYRYAKSSGDTKNAAGDLIDTLWRNKDETILGAYGQWLLAQAYLDLGFWDQAEKMARLSRADAPDVFKPCIDYTLAQALAKKDRRAEAAELLSNWVERENPYRMRARFQLARLALEDRQYRTCIDMCQSLWRERSLGDDAALLSVWGAALEGAGDLAKAAQCYAGKAPE